MRRRLLLAAPAVLAGCSVLPNRPYLERRDWPLAPVPPAAVASPTGSPVLLVRTLRAAPGMDIRGLQVLQPDGSVHTDFYEEWTVPPADAVEEALRRWLAASGLFSAVLAPGSRAHADLVLEGELLALVADPGAGESRAALALSLLDQRRGTATVMLQAEVRGKASLASRAAPLVAASGVAALAAMLGAAERRLAAALGR